MMEQVDQIPEMANILPILSDATNLVTYAQEKRVYDAALEEPLLNCMPEESSATLSLTRSQLIRVQVVWNGVLTGLTADRSKLASSSTTGSSESTKKRALEENETGATSISSIDALLTQARTSAVDAPSSVSCLPEGVDLESPW